MGLNGTLPSAIRIPPSPPKRETGIACLSFWRSPFANGKGGRCGGLMEIAQENPAEVFPAHTLFLAKAVGACAETGRSLHYPPCNRNGYRGFGMFFPLFPPSLLFAPWSLCGKHPKAGAGSTARRQKRRIIGLVYQVSPHVWSPFSPKSMRFCPRMPSSPSRSWRTLPVIPYRVPRTGICPGTRTARTALLPRAGSAGADRRGAARSGGTLRPTPALSGFRAIWISGVMRERRSPPFTPTTTYSPAHR